MQYIKGFGSFKSRNNITHRKKEKTKKKKKKKERVIGPATHCQEWQPHHHPVKNKRRQAHEIEASENECDQ